MWMTSCHGGFNYTLEKIKWKEIILANYVDWPGGFKQNYTATTLQFNKFSIIALNYQNIINQNMLWFCNAVKIC